MFEVPLYGVRFRVHEGIGFGDLRPGFEGY